MSDSVNASEALLPFRRDAVASILLNLYTLAGALRGNRKVPRYLPSAAAARKKLLDRMAEVEIEHANARTVTGIVPKKGVGRKFAEVYQFAYSKHLRTVWSCWSHADIHQSHLWGRRLRSCR